MTVDRARAYVDLDGRLPFDTLRDHRDSDLKLWCVYVHIDQDGYALYIGTTSDLKKREANHRHRSDWWPQVTEIRTIGRWTKEIALGVEAGLIHRFQPPYNGHFTGRWESALTDRAEQRRDITYYPRMQIAAPEAWDRIAPRVVMSGNGPKPRPPIDGRPHPKPPPSKPIPPPPKEPKK